MVKWVDMEALENKNDAACPQCVIFQLPSLPIEPLGGLQSNAKINSFSNVSLI